MGFVAPPSFAHCDSGDSGFASQSFQVPNPSSRLNGPPADSVVEKLGAHSDLKKKPRRTGGSCRPNTTQMFFLVS